MGPTRGPPSQLRLPLECKLKLIGDAGHAALLVSILEHYDPANPRQVRPPSDPLPLAPSGHFAV